MLGIQKPPVRWPGGEPPRAARTARARHAGCSWLSPLRVHRRSRRAAFRGRRVRRLLQLRVSTLAGPRDHSEITEQVGWSYAKRRGNPQDDDQRRNVIASLDEADVG